MRVAAQLSLGLLVAACSLDWDRYDPRLGRGVGAAAPVGPGGGGAGMPTSSGGGGAGAAGGTGGTGGAPPKCPLGLELVGQVRSTADLDVADVDLAPDGSVLVTGQYAGTLTFAGASASATGPDTYVATFAPDGAEAALLATQDAGTQLLQDVAFDPTGRLQGVGVFTDTISLGASTQASLGGHDVLWARDLAGDAPALQAWGDVGNQNGDFALAIGPDGSTFLHGSVVGGTTSYGPAASITADAGGYYLHAVRLDLDGEGQWLAPIGVVSFASRRPHLALGESGDVYLGGTFAASLDDLGFSASGALDGYVARLDGDDGQVVWAVQLRASNEARVRGLVQHGERVFVVGSFLGALEVGGESLTSMGFFDGYVAVLDRDDGAVERLYAIASPDGDGLNDVAVDDAGRVYVAGLTAGDLDLGCPLDGFGTDNLFVGLLDATGAPLAGAISLGNYGLPVLDVRDGAVVLAAEFDGEIRVGDDEVTATGTDEDVAVLRILP